MRDVAVYCYCCQVAQLYLTLCDLVDCSLPGSSVHEILSAEYWSGLPFPSPEDLPDQGIELASPAWQADSLPADYQESPHYVHYLFIVIQFLY